jgi:hypothetical protein
VHAVVDGEPDGVTTPLPTDSASLHPPRRSSWGGVRERCVDLASYQLAATYAPAVGSHAVVTVYNT